MHSNVEVNTSHERCPDYLQTKNVALYCCNPINFIIDHFLVWFHGESMFIVIPQKCVVSEAEIGRCVYFLEILAPLTLECVRTIHSRECVILYNCRWRRSNVWGKCTTYLHHIGSPLSSFCWLSDIVDIAHREPGMAGRPFISHNTKTFFKRH